ncbi:hypothetical protein [Micromonospora rifamycinica]|uniref:Uncharacterized protein n=1 Tax=Micromonospora rifamycinica TaxID=291594 RepID=A0A109ILZ7_9ACTN|nr:hypothetical protein [Micromonospora rifamycinica]KWV32981.1 hypothetical protein AWV63_09580 [Micromonospora rifamycinica]SCG38679.1 hypothetical protein GA0070623_0467 [Micromonospora rifamycinica]
MMTMWLVLGVAALVTVGTVGWVAWRDRARATGAGDRAAGQEAQARQQRYEAERHLAQGGTIQRGRPHH